MFDSKTGKLYFVILLNKIKTKELPDPNKKMFKKSDFIFHDFIFQFVYYQKPPKQCKTVKKQTTKSQKKT